MDDVSAKAAIVHAIGQMADELPATWNGATVWADCAQELGDLIFQIGQFVTPAQLSTLMSAAALSHRQCKRERALKGGAA